MARKGVYKRIVDLRPSPTLSYILGVVLGDGNITYSERLQRWSIRLQVKDKGFINEFSEALMSLGLKTRISTSQYTYSKWNLIRDFHTVVAETKMLAGFIKQIKEEEGLLFDLIQPFPKYFLRGFFQSEGSFDRRRWSITISNNNLFLLEVCRELLTQLNFEPRIYHYSRRGQHSLFLSGGKEKAIKFLIMLDSVCLLEEEDKIDLAEKVNRFLDKIDKLPYKRASDTVADHIIGLYKRGYPIYKLAKIFKISNYRIYNILNEAGVSIRN